MISIVQTINTNIDAASLVMELMKADNLGTINNTQTIDDVKYGIFIDESLGNFLTIEATLVKDSKDTSNLQSNLSNQIAGQESIVQTTYIGNKNTLVFHEKSCGYLPDRKNQVSLSSRDEAVERGYKACKRCYP